MQNLSNTVSQLELYNLSKEQIIKRSPFARDVLTGLTANAKYLQAKYLYDDTGSRIFQDIMGMQEYYLTDCEYEIFDNQKYVIAEHIFNDNTLTDIIELGAGDGLKTRVLLKYFLLQHFNFQYVPIDISNQAINDLVASVKKELPTLKTREMVGDYFAMMRQLNQISRRPKIVLFLGSNIGNYNLQQTRLFLQGIREVMSAKDKLLIGFDLKKDPHLIFNAYNDPHGHTKNFNLNLLARINETLNADFQLEHFQHFENYDPHTGTAKSYLVSTRDQTVTIELLETALQFKAWETILVEQSQKYDNAMIESLASEHGFNIVTNLYDNKKYFCNSIWQIK